MNIAIITGASSGVGTEYFKALTKDKTLDEIWLIARRKEKLEALQTNFPDTNSRVIAMDLTAEENYVKLQQILQLEQPRIQLLINNAGYGKLGYLDEIEYTDHLGIIDLNIKALTTLCTIALPYMHKGSAIVNLCSIAAFAPNPRMTVYSSTKAYVFSFSKSLREELKPKGINVLAVCPGPMSTEFLSVAGIGAGSSKTFDMLPYCDPCKVAVNSIKKAKQGRAVYTPTFFFKFYRVLAKLLPHNFVMKLSKT